MRGNRQQIKIHFPSAAFNSNSTGLSTSANPLKPDELPSYRNCPPLRLVECATFLIDDARHRLQ
jgi:hypothetical protein